MSCVVMCLHGLKMCAVLLHTDCQSRHVCSVACITLFHTPLLGMELCARCFFGRSWAICAMGVDVLHALCRPHLFFSWMAYGLVTINCNTTSTSEATRTNITAAGSLDQTEVTGTVMLVTVPLLRAAMIASMYRLLTADCLVLSRSLTAAHWFLV